MNTTKPPPAVWPGECQDSAVATPIAGETSSAVESAGLVARIEERQAERNRLISLCQQLRAQDRCPGRCVFTGELRQGVLEAFRDELGSTR